MINHPKLTPQTIPDLELIMTGAAPIGQLDVEKFLAKYVLAILIEICY